MGFGWLSWRIANAIQLSGAFRFTGSVVGEARLGVEWHAFLLFWFLGSSDIAIKPKKDNTLFG